jgi:hypothetical protein
MCLRTLNIVSSVILYLYVIVVTLLMKLLMNKFAHNVIPTHF